MTDEELKQMVAKMVASVERLSVEHAKTEESHRLTEESQRKTEESQRKTEEALRRSDEKLTRQLAHVDKQLGGLGNKFGSYTEGLADSSMRKILRERFHADNISPRVKAHRGGRTQEFDMVGVRNGTYNEVYVVEIKSELNLAELQKTLKKLREFAEFMPQYRGMKIYGVISAVDVRGALADRVLQEGLYLATASDENFKLVKPPSGFKPKAFVSQ